MNRGTNQNIITQLGMTADEYNLITVVYYVSDFQKYQHLKTLAHRVHRSRTL